MGPGNQRLRPVQTLSLFYLIQNEQFHLVLFVFTLMSCLINMLGIRMNAGEGILLFSWHKIDYWSWILGSIPQSDKMSFGFSIGISQWNNEIWKLVVWRSCALDYTKSCLLVLRQIFPRSCPIAFLLDNKSKGRQSAPVFAHSLVNYTGWQENRHVPWKGSILVTNSRKTLER